MWFARSTSYGCHIRVIVATTTITTKLTTRLTIEYILHILMYIAMLARLTTSTFEGLRSCLSSINCVILANMRQHVQIRSRVHKRLQVFRFIFDPIFSDSLFIYNWLSIFIYIYILLSQLNIGVATIESYSCTRHWPNTVSKSHSQEQGERTL